MLVQLHGGNFGGAKLDIQDSVRYIAIQDSNGWWLYDRKLHEQTPTADFVGMAAAQDSRMTAALKLSNSAFELAKLQ